MHTKSIKVLLITLGVLLIILCAINIFLTQYFDLGTKWVTVRSKIDNYPYNVNKKYTNTQQAANILAEINRRNIILIQHLTQNFIDTKYRPAIIRLNHRYNPDILFEISPDNIYGDTSYISDKGGKYGMCIRNYDNKNKFTDINTLMFVNLHELTHLSTKEYGHGKEFMFIFVLLLTEATKLNIYKPENYSKYPKKFCSITISSNPLFY
jgi:hypothetical protein